MSGGACPALCAGAWSGAVGIVSLLAVVKLRKDLAGAAGTDNASLILNGRSLVAVHDATFLLGPAFCAAIGNGLVLGYMLYRSELVPRRFAQFGMAAGSLALVTAVLVLFGAYKQVSGRSRRNSTAPSGAAGSGSRGRHAVRPKRGLLLIWWPPLPHPRPST